MAAQDFAHIRLGHFLNKSNLSGALVTCHLLFAILNDLGLSQLRLVFDNIGLDDLTELTV